MAAHYTWVLMECGGGTFDAQFAGEVEVRSTTRSSDMVGVVAGASRNLSQLEAIDEIRALQMH